MLRTGANSRHVTSLEKKLVGLHVQCSLFLSNFNQSLLSKKLVNFLVSNFMKFPLVALQLLHADRGTERCRVKRVT